MTTVIPGAMFETAYDYNGTFTILLYDKNGLKAAFPSDHLKWLKHCMLFKFAKKYKNIKIMQIIIDLIEEHDLHCTEMTKRLIASKTAMPMYYHCFSCLNQTVMLKSSRCKQSLE
jgi:hypothetical protein